MRVTGPNWPSTTTLREALRDVESEKVISWGQGGKDATQQLYTFQAARVPCPQFTIILAEAQRWVREGMEVWGRKSHHTQGRDIQPSGYKLLPGRAASQGMRWITTRKGARVRRPFSVPAVNGGEDWNPRWLASNFWVQVIPSVAEYRQHVAYGRAIRSQKKIQVEPHLQGNLLVRSRRRGWHLDAGDWVRPTGLRELGKAACAAVGYTFGAVDILEKEDGQLVVLEVNSAPALTDNRTLASYVEAIKRWGR